MLISCTGWRFMRGEANHEGLNDKKDAMDLKTDLCEQSDDFSDDVLRLNSGKLTPVLTFPDQLLACQKESYLLHRLFFRPFLRQIFCLYKKKIKYFGPTFSSFGPAFSSFGPTFSRLTPLFHVLDPSFQVLDPPFQVLGRFNISTAFTLYF